MRRDLMASSAMALPRGVVWAKVSNIAGWSNWHPLVHSLSREGDGELETGDHLRLELRRPQGPQQPPRLLRAEVMRVLPPCELSWITRCWLPGLLDCEYRILLQEPADESPPGVHQAGNHAATHDRQTHDRQTIVIQRIRLSGILVPLLWWRLRPGLAAGLQQASHALRSELSRCCLHTAATS